MGLFGHRGVARNRLGNRIEIHIRLFATLALGRDGGVHGRELCVPVTVVEDDPHRDGLRGMDRYWRSGHGVVRHRCTRGITRHRKSALHFADHRGRVGTENDFGALAVTARLP